MGVQNLLYPFSLSKKSKITFFALEKQLENGYSTLAHLDTFS